MVLTAVEEGVERTVAGVPPPPSGGPPQGPEDTSTTIITPHHRYSYHQDGSMWGRSNGCSPGPVPGAHHQHQQPHPQQQQPHPHRTLTPPPSLPSASSWGTLPSMHRSNTPNPSPWGRSSQISNGSAWNSGPTSGDCMLGPSSLLHLCFIRQMKFPDKGLFTRIFFGSCPLLPLVKILPLCQNGLWAHFLSLF